MKVYAAHGMADRFSKYSTASAIWGDEHNGSAVQRFSARGQTDSDSAGEPARSPQYQLVLYYLIYARFADGASNYRRCSRAG
jgi:hypothetical protein